jgi:hypothetical protein
MNKDSTLEADDKLAGSGHTVAPEMPSKEKEAHDTSLASPQFQGVMNTEIAEVDRQKQREIEAKARQVANKD